MSDRPPSPARLELEAAVLPKAKAVTDAIIRARQKMQKGLHKAFPPKPKTMPPAIQIDDWEEK